MGSVLAEPGATGRILRTHNIRAVKKWGQNFLTDGNIIAKIVAEAQLAPADTVLEIGPGLGTLTQALAATGAKVTAVEIDRRLVAVLKETLVEYPSVSVINADILELNIDTAVGNAAYKVVANLPYYITTPIIFALLEQVRAPELLVVMVQKEVAERMTASPGGKDYGALSVALQYHTEARIAFTVPPAAFIPSPGVTSAVLVCQRRIVPPVVVTDEKLFFRVVKAAFSVRRKMLSNALKNMGLNGQETAIWLDRAGIDGRRRGETLTLEEFAALANTWVN